MKAENPTETGNALLAFLPTFVLAKQTKSGYLQTIKR